MGTAARLTLCVRRYQIARFTIRIENIDLSQRDVAMQVRLQPGTPGAPLILLEKQLTTAAEGIKIEAVLENGIPVTYLRGRINKSTMSDAAKVPYAGELGELTILSYGLVITDTAQTIANGADAQERLYGDFVVADSAFGSDNAPANRPVGYPAVQQLPSGGTASLTFGDTIVDVTLNGVSEVAALVKQATDAAAAVQPIVVDLALGASSKIAIVAGDLSLGANSKVGAVATSIANVNAVGANLLGANTIGQVAQALTNIGIVAGGISDVGTVAADLNLGASSLIRQAPGAATSAAASAALAANIAGSVRVVPTPGSAGGFLDGFGRFFGLVGLDGSVKLANLAANLFTPSVIVQGTSQRLASAPAGWLHVWRDTFGRIFAGFKTTGEFAIGAIVGLKTINGKDVAALLAGTALGSTAAPAITDAEVNHVLLYGQSIDAGTGSVPVLTTTPLYDGIRFNGGVRPYDTAEGANRTSLVPLIETVDPATGNTLGETPASAMDAGIKQGLIAKYGIPPGDRPYQMLMSCQARGGTPSAGLAVGTTPYQACKDDISAGYALCAAADKTYQFRLLTVYNGESDMQNNVSAASHISNWTGVRDGLDAHAKSVNPGNDDLILAFSQVWAHASYGHANDPYIALAQLQLTRDQPTRYVMMGNFAHLPVNGLPHTTNKGSQWRGAYYSRVYQRLFVEKGVWKPLAPTKVRRTGKALYVSFEPESGQLAIDTGTLPDQGSKGFTLVDASGNAITISSVALAGANTIKIIAAATIPAGAKLRTGFGSGKTNIRDTMGNTEKRTIQGETYVLHNWCVISETTVA